MSERLVGLDHLVDVIPLANRITLALEGLHQFGGERLLHGNTLAGIGKVDGGLPGPGKCDPQAG